MTFSWVGDYDVGYDKSLFLLGNWCLLIRLLACLTLKLG